MCTRKLCWICHCIKSACWFGFSNSFIACYSTSGEMLRKPLFLTKPNQWLRVTTLLFVLTSYCWTSYFRNSKASIKKTLNRQSTVFVKSHLCYSQNYRRLANGIPVCSRNEYEFINFGVFLPLFQHTISHLLHRQIGTICVCIWTHLFRLCKRKFLTFQCQSSNKKQHTILFD